MREAFEKWGEVQKARDDACLYGTGFYRVHPSGLVEHIPFEEVRMELGPVQPGDCVETPNEAEKDA